MMKESSNPSNVQKEVSFDTELPSVSEEHPKQKCSLQKDCMVTFILGMPMMILWLIAVYIFLFESSWHESDASVRQSTDVPTQATMTSTPTAPSLAPSLSATTLSPTQSPTDLGRGVREFLFKDATTSSQRSARNPAAAKAIDWLVEEAVQSSQTDALSPFNQKFLQRFGILILYFSINADKNDNPLPNLGMRNRDECSWTGMTCDSDGMLVSIQLPNRQLDGTLPAEWGFFPNLKSIDLLRNNLKGSIPEELYDVLGLEQVFLYRNQLSGTISSKIGQLWKLTHFHVADNRISGSIPPEMASSRQIRQLQHFNVHNNQMSGVIPRNMRLRRMNYMDLGHNRISGTLPPDLGTDYVRLRHLYLDHNHFLGTVPESYVVAGQGRIKTLYLNDNKLSGPFPGKEHLFRRMQELKVENNNFDACTRGIYPFETPTILNSTCDICNCRGLFMCRFCKDHPY